MGCALGPAQGPDPRIYTVHRPDWREETEAYETARYQPLRDRMLAVLPKGWSVEIVNFTLGIRGSFAETQCTAALTALGVSAT
jgi:cobalamin biosynthesis protein CbiG